MVTVKKPPFSRKTWTHVAFTFEKINAGEGEPAAASLYLNGELQGTIRSPMQFHWDSQRTAIMIGIEYIGDFDELAIFSRSLSPAEVSGLYRLPAGLTAIP